MIFLTVLLFFLVLFIVVLCYANRRNKECKKLPGPVSLPFFGSVLDFWNTKKVLQVAMGYTKKYGNVVYVEIGPFRKFLLIAGQEVLSKIINNVNFINKSEEYTVNFRPWLGSGLLTSDEPKWRKHRKLLTPAFHFQILEQFIEVFESCGTVLCQKLEAEVGSSSFDIYPYVTRCTLDTICESIMGIEMNVQNNGSADYVKSVKDMCRIVYERSISLVPFWMTRNFWTQRAALKILHGVSDSVIEQRRKMLEQQPPQQEQEVFVRNKKAFLDLLLQAKVDGRPLTHEEIREEVDTFLFEGHDTTASGVSFTLYCLATHPEVQQKVYEEQKLLFGDNKTLDIKYADLQNMNYLELVIKEALRLYPSVPLLGRKSNGPIEIDCHRIVTGVDTIAISIFGLHRDPTYFKDPEKFDPSRFEQGDKIPPYAYIPFSAGSRNCIGQKFAMLELKSIVSKIVRNFELVPAIPYHSLKIVAYSVLVPANGIKVGLNARS